MKRTEWLIGAGLGMFRNNMISGSVKVKKDEYNDIEQVIPTGQWLVGCKCQFRIKEFENYYKIEFRRR